MNNEVITQKLKSGVRIPAKCKVSEIPNTRGEDNFVKVFGFAPNYRKCEGITATGVES